MEFTDPTDEYYMKEAIKEALKAAEAEEIPVGCVVVCNKKIIGRGYNQVELLNDGTAHAEIIALTSAFNYLGAKVLEDCQVYVTLEPCPMCAGAFYLARPSKLVFGASDSKRGYRKFSKEILHPKTEVQSGILGGECEMILLDFFKNLRG